LDVTVPEPLPTDHRLLTLDNCIIFPHIGSGDVATRYQMAQICVDNLLNFFGGKPMIHQLNIDNETWIYDSNNQVKKMLSITTDNDNQNYVSMMDISIL
jgi:hypothetical protein